MTDYASTQYDVFDEMHRLVAASLADTIAPEEEARLDALVAQSVELCDLYLDLIFQSSILITWATHDEPGPEELQEPPVSQLRQAGPTDPTAESLRTSSPGFPAISLEAPPGYFPSGWPVAYLIATVIFALGLAVGALVHVSQPMQVVLPSHSASGAGGEGSRDSLPSFVVARVTGMVDCVWERPGNRGQGSGTANQKSEILNHKSPLRLGDRLALKSGLLEITYDTGATVILQGPVTYEVESAAGGFLSIGKLTARLEKKSAVSGQRSESANQKSEILNHKSPAPRPRTSDLFAIRTPTALVTDLGTEFGVEVNKGGNTTTHVYRGLVRVQPLGDDGKPKGDAMELRENVSAQVGGSQRDRTIVVAPAAKAANFVREMPMQSAKTLDLVDVVAGGDGFSGKRNSGIDATNGKPTTALAPSGDVDFIRAGDGQYHPVDGMPLVDGVFIPDGRAGGVQIDSTGRTFAGFPATTNATSAYLWAGGVVPGSPAHPRFHVVPTTLSGIDYSLPGHQVLFLHANKGITFDLQAVRRANPQLKPLRFCTTAGSTEPVSDEQRWVYADIWVLVDGKVRFQRRQINKTHGAFSVVIPIAEGDRFLTLAATDGGDGIACDWIIFGDPRIELRSDTAGNTRVKSSQD